MPDSFARLSLCDDVEPAAWLRRALRPWTDRRLQHVSSLVPSDYGAHGRILHHAWRGDDPVRWSVIAEETGRLLDAGTRFNALVGWDVLVNHDPPPPWRSPDRGSLQPDECAAAAEVLAGYTTTPDDCWFCLWEGYGWPLITRLGERAPRVRLEHRNCLLFRGPVSAAVEFRSEPWFQSPTLWWPDDRAWCVASELDSFSTYVAASTPALRALTEDPRIEVLECPAGHEIDPSPYPPSATG